MSASRPEQAQVTHVGKELELELRVAGDEGTEQRSEHAADEPLRGRDSHAPAQAEIAPGRDAFGGDGEKLHLLGLPEHQSTCLGEDLPGASLDEEPAPSRSSSAATRRPTVGCATLSARAAAEKEPERATARKSEDRPSRSRRGSLPQPCKMHGRAADSRVDAARLGDACSGHDSTRFLARPGRRRGEQPARLRSALGHARRSTGRARVRAICFDLFTLFDPRSVTRVAERVVPGRRASSAPNGGRDSSSTPFCAEPPESTLLSTS